MRQRERQCVRGSECIVAVRNAPPRTSLQGLFDVQVTGRVSVFLNFVFYVLPATLP